VSERLAQKGNPPLLVGLLGPFGFGLEIGVLESM